MAYTKVNWRNGEVALSDTNLNHMDQGIYDAHELIAALTTPGNPVLLAMHPVGDVVFNTSGINPSTYIGGTWVQWGKGRVPVGVDSEDTNFDTVEKEGGAKTVTLTVNQIPSHNHTYSRHSEYSMITPTTGGNTYAAPKVSSEENVNTGNKGGGQAHTNLQPYITCYMWKRTA